MAFLTAHYNRSTISSLLLLHSDWCSTPTLTQRLLSYSYFNLRNGLKVDEQCRYKN